MICVAEIKQMEERNKKLITCAMNGDLMTLKLCLANGADINYQDSKNLAALHLAATVGNRDMIGFLIAAGADINLLTTLGRTPLHITVKCYNIDTTSMLLCAGADINVKNFMGETPFFIAVYNGDKPMSELLFKWGASINIKNCDGQTPLHFTAENGNSELAAFLIKARANLNLQDDRGNTPLHLAVINNRNQIINDLIKSGARLDILNKQKQTSYDLRNETMKTLEEHYQRLLEIQRLGVETAAEFQDIMQFGMYKCFWNRIYLVGPYGVGKSTLAKILVGEPISLEWESTDGIWIYMGRAGMDVEQSKWVFLSKGNSIREVLNNMLKSLKVHKAATPISGMPITPENTTADKIVESVETVCTKVEPEVLQNKTPTLTQISEFEISELPVTTSKINKNTKRSIRNKVETHEENAHLAHPYPHLGHLLTRQTKKLFPLSVTKVNRIKNMTVMEHLSHPFPIASPNFKQVNFHRLNSPMTKFMNLRFKQLKTENTSKR